MKPEYVSWIWMIGGVILMVLELVIPGLIIVFFGAAAVIVGLLNLIGVLTGVLNSIIAWFIISLILVLFFRKLALKFFPSDSSYQLVEEDVDAIGTVVEVIKTVDDKSTNGRISYQGTSWPAISNKGIIKAKKKARLVHRDNISWVVEPYDDTE